MTPSAISGRTGIPLEIVEQGIAILEQPDPHSRTPDEEGRRIVRVDEHRPWGWVLVNHGKYKDLKDAGEVRAQVRERVRRHRERKRAETGGNAGNGGVTPGNGKKPPTDATTTEEIDRSFDQWYAGYPRKEAKPNAIKAWRKLNASDRQAALAALETWPFPDDKKFTPLPASWLNARRWEDECTAPPEPRPYVR